MSEKQVVKVLMAFGAIGQVVTVIVFLYALVAIIFGSDTNYGAAFAALGGSILSFVSFTAFIGFAYIVKYVCKVED